MEPVTVIRGPKKNEVFVVIDSGSRTAVSLTLTEAEAKALIAMLREAVEADING